MLGQFNPGRFHFTGAKANGMMLLSMQRTGPIPQFSKGRFLGFQGPFGARASTLATPCTIRSLRQFPKD